MSYPDYPDNRLIVNGVDLSERFKMVLLDGYTLSPPEPKIYTVDIPGGNGVLDLTESLLGDTAYGKREQTFQFAIIDVNDFERSKMKISNFLHGKAYDYEMTMDPGYRYHGRFFVSSYAHAKYAIGKVGTIEIRIEADPYKYATDRVYRIPAIGGKTVYLAGGRKRVRPTIETGGYLKVIHDGKLITLPKGTWKLNDVLFHDGVNEIYVNSYDIRNLTWGDLKTNNITCAQFERKPLFEWYKSNGDGTYVIPVWNDMLAKTWEEAATSKWGSSMYKNGETKDIQDVYIKYEVGEL